MNLEALYERINATPARRWLDQLPHDIAQAMDPARHGKLPEWLDSIARMPAIRARNINLSDRVVSIGDANEIDAETRQLIHNQLWSLLPWRKGPYSVFGTFIDTEWRSDMKWDRLLPHISPLHDRWVLDVGCGSGYHCWRMLGAGAKEVIGIDPTMLFGMQFRAIHRLTDCQHIQVLPLAMEQLPADLSLFDTVFSMGVLYHRRSPIDHLLELRDSLKPGGELVLETLIVDGPKGYTLMPEERYARMRNVWFLPSLATLEQWLTRCGFECVRSVDINVTSVAEQRTTAWMPAESLQHALSPQNRQKTVENLPAPTRAIVLARRKSND